MARNKHRRRDRTGSRKGQGATAQFDCLWKQQGGMRRKIATALASSRTTRGCGKPAPGTRLCQITGKISQDRPAGCSGAPARFAQSVRPETRYLPDPQVRELQALVNRRKQIIEMRVSEKNRLFTAHAKIKPSIQKVIDFLTQEIEQLDDDIRSNPAQRCMA